MGLGSEENLLPSFSFAISKSLHGAHIPILERSSKLGGTKGSPHFLQTISFLVDLDSGTGFVLLPILAAFSPQFEHLRLLSILLRSLGEAVEIL
jgi:hypothetical protein